MKKAIQIECETMKNSIPVILSEEEQGWSDCDDSAVADNIANQLLWHSNVPGSGADEHVIIGAIQDVEHMGFDVTEAEKYLEEGMKAREELDYPTMARLSARIFYLLNNAPKIKDHPYWSFTSYESFEQYSKKVNLPTYNYNKNSDEFLRRTYLAWVAQIVGGALGTAIEGYTGEALKKAFGNITDYVRKPNTYNDDITYELCFLEALKEKGSKLTSYDIAEQWARLIPTGWSAEDRALKNIKLGVFPPESGMLNNPFREWIGAQMRGVICGMVAPGDVKKAAYYAFNDGQVSHHNNGVLGEVFNAIMASLAYVKEDIKEVVKEAISLMPNDSEYYSVVKFALEQCEKYNTWEEAWKPCEEKYGVYNWIHAYPNAAAEVVALYFGNGDFDKTMNIISMEGFDIDCNAAQIASIVVIANGKELNKKWTDPIGDDLYTYMRVFKKISIKQLAKDTVEASKNA